MSGGFAFVLDEDGLFSQRCNEGMVSLEPLTDADDVALVKRTDRGARSASPEARKARRLLARWEQTDRLASSKCSRTNTGAYCASAHSSSVPPSSPRTHSSKRRANSARK